MKLSVSRILLSVCFSFAAGVAQVTPYLNTPHTSLDAYDLRSAFIPAGLSPIPTFERRIGGLGDVAIVAVAEFLDDSCRGAMRADGHARILVWVVKEQCACPFICGGHAVPDQNDLVGFSQSCCGLNLEQVP